MPRPAARRATLHAKYFTERTFLATSHWPDKPMDLPGRRYLCAGCRAAVLICSRCDRGHRYCTARCAEHARRRSVRTAGCRYQASLRGRHAHADRQRRYRARQQKVTHQGSPPTPVFAQLSPEPIALAPASPALWHCHVCRCPLPEFVRQDFLRRRIRRFIPSDRSTRPHGPSP